MSTAGTLTRLGLALEAGQLRVSVGQVRSDLEQLRRAGTATQQTFKQDVPAGFQQSEQSANRLTVAIQRMQAANRQVQADAMASQIAQRDPFQAVSVRAEQASGHVRAFGQVTGHAAVLIGGMNRQMFVAASALGSAAEKFLEMRAAQVAANATTGATTTLMGTLGATLKSINPLILLAVAGYASYAITTKLLGDNTDELVEAAEKNIATQDKLASAMRAVNEAMRQSILATSNAKAELAAYLRGGESALQTAKNFAAALVVGAAAAKAGLDSERAAVAEFNRLQALTAAQQGLTAAQRASAAAEAVQKNIAATAEALREEIVELTKGKAALEQYRLEKVKTGATPPIVTPEELQRLANLRRDIQRALQPIENLPIAAGGLITTTIDELPPAIERVRAELDETFGQRLGRYAVNFSSLADELIGAFSGAADAIRGELQGVFGGGTFGTALGGFASAGVSALFGGLFNSIADAFSSGGNELRDALKAWNDELDRFLRDLRSKNDPLRQELDSLQDWYDDQLKALENFRLSTSGSVSTGAFGGLAGFEQQQRWNALLDSRTPAEYVERLAKLNEIMAEATAQAEALAAAEHARLIQDLNAELARAQGNDSLARQIERQQRLNDAKTKEEQVLLKQIFRAEDAARANAELAESMRTMQDRIEETRRVVDSIQEFRNSLLLGPQSPLSPVQQLQESRRQFEAMASLALGGDRSAAASLPDTIRAFLDASRGVNASGGRFQTDFQRAQDLLAQVQGRFAGELSVEEEALKELKMQTRDVTGRLDRNNDVFIAKTTVMITELQATVGVLQAGFLEQIAESRRIREAVEGLDSTVDRSSDMAAL